MRLLSVSVSCAEDGAAQMLCWAALTLSTPCLHGPARKLQVCTAWGPARTDLLRVVILAPGALCADAALLHRRLRCQHEALGPVAILLLPKPPACSTDKLQLCVAGCQGALRSDGGGLAC